MSIKAMFTFPHATIPYYIKFLYIFFTTYCIHFNTCTPHLYILHVHTLCTISFVLLSSMPQVSCNGRTMMRCSKQANCFPIIDLSLDCLVRCVTMSWSNPHCSHSQESHYILGLPWLLIMPDWTSEHMAFVWWPRTGADPGWGKGGGRRCSAQSEPRKFC